MEENEMNVLAQEVRAVRELVIRMDERMNMVQDHEARLRGLERWRYALPSALFIAIGSAIAALAPLFVK